jgi:hypothetical protein
MLEARLPGIGHVFGQLGQATKTKKLFCSSPMMDVSRTSFRLGASLTIPQLPQKDNLPIELLVL